MADSKWWLYIVETCYGHFYTGVTTDVARRLKEHTQGAPRGARALRGKGPLQLRYKRCIGTRSQAQQIEYAVKQLPRSRKSALINDECLLEMLVSLPLSE